MKYFLLKLYTQRRACFCAIIILLTHRFYIKKEINVKTYINLDRG